MKLLIITQKINKKDSILGFFHRWVEEFSKKYEQVSVICLEKGEYNLPENVQVFSLGKEEGVSRIKYIFNFYKYIWREHKNYDSVFVHMNPEYVIFGGVFWKILGKKIYLWYNHKIGNLKARIAIFFSEKVFFTSKFAYSSRFGEGIIMPVGIDSESFKFDELARRETNSILSVGRISPVKRIDVLVAAVKMLDREGEDFVLRIYGEPANRDKEYFDKIKTTASSLEEKGKVVFAGSVVHKDLPAIYNQNEVFVNLTQSGSFDKTILEAMVCGDIVLVSNKTMEGVLPKDFVFEGGDAVDLSEKIKKVFALSETQKKEHRDKLIDYVLKNHSLEILSNRLGEEIK